MNSFLGVYRSLALPRSYFSEVPAEHWFRSMVFGTGSLLIVAAILIFAAAAWNADEIRRSGMEFLRQQGLSQADLPFRLKPAPPHYLLTFPLYWVAILLATALVRMLALSISAAAARPPLFAIAITGHSLVPMILVAAVLGFYNQLFPVDPSNTGGELGRVFWSLLLFVFGWCLEGRIWITAARLVYAQSAGRAVFTWLAPSVVAILTVVFGFVAMIAYNAARQVG